VPTWDTKQEVFNITELFSIDKGTPTDSGAAAKRRAGGDYGVFDTWIEGAFQVHSSWSTRFEEADEAFRLQAKEAWIVAHGPSRSNTAAVKDLLRYFERRFGDVGFSSTQFATIGLAYVSAWAGQRERARTAEWLRALDVHDDLISWDVFEKRVVMNRFVLAKMVEAFAGEKDQKSARSRGEYDAVGSGSTPRTACLAVSGSMGYPIFGRGRHSMHGERHGHGGGDSTYESGGQSDSRGNNGSTEAGGGASTGTSIGTSFG
jgi:hypothetical protein